MVNTSKILTVSYGTFSCTLEGFDDSFEMMKAIAEYFRDLAQDDRYFGAEPPTPDAQMLAQIAEREMSRRVEARQERGSIVLRPSAEPEAAPAPVEAPIPPVQVAQPVHQPQEDHAAAEEPFEDIDFDEDAEFEEELAELEAELSEEAPAPAPVAAQDEEDSIAAKLSRIRAVVSRAPETQPEPAYSEDEHAQDASDDTAATIAAALREPDMPMPDLDEEEDDLAGFADAYLEDEEAPVEDPQLAEDIAQASAAPAPAADTPARARVIRMKRTDFEAALAEGQLEEDEDAGLSPEDEADLMKELAEVEAELKRAQDEDEDEDEEMASIFAEDEEEEAPVAPRAPAPRPAATGKVETDVGRLMEKAEQEMDRPDGAHRRSAIAHLRAAVQATRAETEAGGGLNRSEDSVSAYRDDLNHVVRPRRPRPAPEAEAPRRPASKPAPLKLVAEQRVDAPAPAPAPAQPVRPRRVSVADIHDDETAESLATASSFVEFAEKAGVKDLSELMEAAAAYMSYVEGRQKFSRPQLMNKARLVEEYAFSREDGLRSFGQLLRQGKIEKLKGGRFTVSDDLIGFKPDGARAAG